MPSSSRAKGIQEHYMSEQEFRVLETLDRVAVAHSAMVSQVALAWSRAQSSIPCAIAAPPRSSSCTNCEAGAGFRFVKMN